MPTQLHVLHIQSNITWHCSSVKVSHCDDTLCLSLEIKVCTMHACRVMFCGLLFLGGNVLKKALAKLFSSHFYKATHYDKMQDALRKVQVSWAMPQTSATLGMHSAACVYILKVWLLMRSVASARPSNKHACLAADTDTVFLCIHKVRLCTMHCNCTPVSWHVNVVSHEIMY